MLGERDYAAGPSAEVLTEAALTALYGAPLKRIAFDHEGRRIETFAPILPVIGAAQREIRALRGWRWRIIDDCGGAIRVNSAYGALREWSLAVSAQLIPWRAYARVFRARTCISRLPRLSAVLYIFLYIGLST
jgi:hypothetical protein